MRLRKLYIVWLLTLSGTALAFQGSGATASIEGRVIAQATGVPLKNAVLTLHPVGLSPRERAIRDLAQRAGDDGRFVFTNIPPGDWELSADRRGFLPAKYGARKYDIQGQVIALKAGDRVSDVILKLVGQAAVSGRVIDSEGEPVEGVRVTLLKPEYANGATRYSEVGFASTLDNGEYRIPRVPAGRYFVQSGTTRVRIGAAETTYAATFYPNTPEISAATVVKVSDDGTGVSGVDVRVSPVPVFHIRGRFLTPGQSRAGRVCLLDRFYPSRVLAEASITGPDQSFDLGDVPSGSYLLYAYSLSTREWRASGPVEVKFQDVEDVILTADEGLITGGVTLKPGGRPVDLRMLEIKILEIELDRLRTGNRLPAPVRLGSNLKFAYTTRGFHFVNFAVTVAKLPEGCYVTSLQYGGRDVSPYSIEFLPGAVLDISIGTDGAILDGETLDQNDRAQGGAVVALISADHIVRAVQSSGEGKFRLSGIPPGDYRVIAWDDAGQFELEDPSFINQFDNRAKSLSFSSGGYAAISVRAITR